MRDSQRNVLVGLFLGVAVSACGRSTRMCPQGMEVVSGRTTASEIWCKSADGQLSRWVELYDAKARRQSCAFNGGRPEGSFQSWHPDGKQWVVGEYRAGRKVGKWTQWGKDGTRVAEGEYQDGNLVAGAPVGLVAACEKRKP